MRGGQVGEAWEGDGWGSEKRGRVVGIVKKVEVEKIKAGKVEVIKGNSGRERRGSRRSVGKG